MAHTFPQQANSYKSSSPRAFDPSEGRVQSMATTHSSLDAIYTNFKRLIIIIIIFFLWQKVGRSTVLNSRTRTRQIVFQTIYILSLPHKSPKLRLQFVSLILCRMCALYSSASWQSCGISSRGNEWGSEGSKGKEGKPYSNARTGELLNQFWSPQSIILSQVIKIAKFWQRCLIMEIRLFVFLNFKIFGKVRFWNLLVGLNNMVTPFWNFIRIVTKKIVEIL